MCFYTDLMKIIMETTDEKRDKVDNFTYTVRRSVIFPLINLVVIEILVLGLEFGMKIVVDYCNSRFGFNLPTYTFMMWTIVIMQLFNVFLVIRLMISWLFTFYIIRPREVIFVQGLIYRKETKYEFEHLERIDVHQGIIGRWLHFGTLVVYNHDLIKEVYIYDIPNPQKYSAEILQYQGSLQERIIRMKAGEYRNFTYA